MIMEKGKWIMQLCKNNLSIIPILLFAANIHADNTYSVKACRDLAVKENLCSKNAAIDIKRSEEVKKSTFMKYIPEVNANVMAIRFNDPVIDTKISGGNLPVYDGNPANIGTATQFAYFPDMPFTAVDKGIIGVLSATQPVYTGGRIYNGNRLASIGLDAKKVQNDLKKNEISFETEKMYWQIVSTGEKIATLDSYRNLLDTLNKEATDAYNAGLINKNDLLKVSIKQTGLEKKRLVLENSIRFQKQALCQVMGISFDPQMALSDTLYCDKSPQEIRADHESSLKKRYEYSLLEKSVEAARLETKMKRGEFLPQMAVGVGGFYNKNLTGSDASVDVFAFATVKIPLSAAWSAVPEVREQKFKEEMAKNEMLDKIDKMTLQIQKNWDGLSESYKQIDICKKMLIQANENLKINNDNYRAGVVNISDMLEAQAIYQETKDNLSDAKADYMIRIASYLLATGKYTQAN